MKNTATAALVLAGALSLTACTTTPEECDPSVDPGFFNKIGCTFSGSYAQRVEMKRENLQALQEENAHLTRLQQSLADEKTLLEGNMAQRQAQLNTVRENLAGLKKDLAAQGALNRELQQAIAQAEAQAEAMQRSPASQAMLQKRMELQELQSQIDTLTNMVYGNY